MVLVDFLYGLGTGCILGCAGLGYLMFRTNWVQNWLFAQIVDIFEQLPALIAAKPEILQNLLQPILQELQKSGSPDKMGNVNIMGMRIPGFLVQMGLQMLQGWGQAKGSNQALGNTLNAAKDLLGA